MWIFRWTTHPVILHNSQCNIFEICRSKKSSKNTKEFRFYRFLWYYLNHQILTEGILCFIYTYLYVDHVCIHTHTHTHMYMYIVVIQSLSPVRLFVTPWTAACALPCASLSPRVCSDSCPLNWWCHPTISSSVTHFSSCLQSFPASGSFPVSQLFASGRQNIGASASASVLPMNI